MPGGNIELKLLSYRPHTRFVSITPWKCVKPKKNTSEKNTEMLESFEYPEKILHSHEVVFQKCWYRIYSVKVSWKQFFFCIYVLKDIMKLLQISSIVEKRLNFSKSG